MSEASPASARMAQLHHMFASESDRAAVIVATALIDEALLGLLNKRLVPTKDANHSVTGGHNAPLGSFGARINACYQLGLISKYFAADAHLMRRLRNDFAHQTENLSFETKSVKDRVCALAASSNFNERFPEVRGALGPPGARHDFLGSAAWMLYELTSEVDRTEPITARGPEFGYIEWSSLPSDVRAMLEDAYGA